MFIQNLYQQIVNQSLKKPDKVAILDYEETYTYVDIVNKIEKFRQILRYYYSLKNFNFIGLYADNSAISYSVILACALEGITYVPLSVYEPDERLFKILKAAQIEVIIYDQKFEKKILNWGKKYSSDLLYISSEDTHFNLKLKPIITEKSNDLYILFTSGSTGIPKGVSINQTGVENFITWASEYLQVHEDDIFLSHSRITFDLSVFNIYLPLLHGAQVVIVKDLIDQIYPHTFLSKKVTIALVVPRITNNLIQNESLKPLAFPDLRHILFCGEKLLAHHVNAWTQTHPSVFVHNIYGPTETTVTCTYYTIQPGQKVIDPVPIGTTIPNMKISFFSGTNIIENGPFESEAYISGVGVSTKNYVGIESNLFDTHPKLGRYFKSGDLLYLDPNNILYWKSRLDFQVKVRGHRVELSEIESILLTQKHIIDACCIFDPVKENIYAFVAAPDPLIKTDQLKNICKLNLPEYMIPSHFYVLTELPKNQNGKVDREQLKKLLS